ncbi:unnamed protein product, partial [Citrullus colocynthis]
SRPILKDRRKFAELVDPLLEGHFPLRCLQHAVAITAMCLQEQPSFRPLISDIVVALEYLASQSHLQELRNGRINSSQSSPSQQNDTHAQESDP